LLKENRPACQPFAGAERQPVTRKKILLADDVELFLELEKTFFRRENFELLIARTGQQAWDLTLAETPDLVFMDLFMPGMDGDAACRLIKQQPQTASIPVVMVTQGGRDDDLERCRLAGCDDILLKPINRHLFVATARRLLQVVDRAEPRVLARLQVRQGEAPNQLLRDYSLNLSTGGLFLATMVPLPVGTPLALEFLLPATSQPIHCQAKVAWINLPERLVNPLLPAGMGVQFLDLPATNLAALREFIKHQCIAPTW